MFEFEDIFYDDFVYYGSSKLISKASDVTNANIEYPIFSISDLS